MPRAAAIADRILFLADGLIVHEQPGSYRGRGPDDDERAGLGRTPSRRDPGRAQGSARPQAARAAHRARDRARRRDGQRHVRPHRHDQGRLQRRSSPPPTRTSDAVVTGKAGLRQQRHTNAPSFPESLLAQGARRCPDVAEAAGGVGDQAQLVGRNGKVISHGGAPGLGSASTRTATSASTRSTLTAGKWPRGPDEIAIDEHTASDRSTITVGDRDRRGRPRRHGAAVQDHRHREVRRRRPRSAARRSRSSTCRRRRRSSTRTGKLDQITSPRSRA